ncbi:glycosyltransferase [Vibrio fluminensis]|uniref:glycosyltransferase n=1 Tax=Vibrio fluminensis TaxID=2783614 RepID=UPI00188931EE|nr:glycosyltransferase [Vibrio fluminensis]
MSKLISIFSITSDFVSYHRKREVLALAEQGKASQVKVHYFNRPRFVFSRGKKEKDSQVEIRDLYTLLPLSIAFKHRVLLWLFVTVPIYLQLQLLRIVSGVATNDSYHLFYKPDQSLYLPKHNNIYIHYDNYSADKGYFFAQQRQFESVLNDCVRNSDMTCFSSRRLMVDLGYESLNNVYVYPNAISRDLVPSQLISQLKDNSEKVIGFVGQLDESFDLELAVHLVEKFPDYKFRFIGPVKVDEYQKVLERYSNVELMGYVDYALLPNYLATFDLAVCLYKPNKFNRYRNPLKIYEYFSYGIPVVTTDCDLEADVASLLSVVNDHNAFSNAVVSQIENNTSERIIARATLARKNCWDDRANFLIEKLCG